MDFIFSNVLGFVRAYPIIVIFTSLIISFLTINVSMFYFAIYLYITGEIVGSIKEHIVRPLMGKKKWPILGKAERPRGKRMCTAFPPNVSCKSLGMPSIHSQYATMSSTYWGMKIWKLPMMMMEMKLMIIGILVFLSLLVMYSRIYWVGAHTIQQTIVGGVIGVLLANLFIKNIDGGD
tara:strand:- start:147 stop:680 length:534 start_codon:yes stop_codon:yes gene_type:complete